ncbi:MAG: hypothetical protein J6M12_05780, partial [Clostridia bacterium]|nr:hypothetical protein [Clostridia bacterium]
STEGGFLPPTADLVEKSQVEIRLVFFQLNPPVAEEINLRWMKSLRDEICLAACEGTNFISHCDQREQYFTIHEVNYFTFAVRRIFHLIKYRIYDIITAERRWTHDYQRQFLK